MDSRTLRNYEMLTEIDLMLNNQQPQYPFTINQQAKFTQHQITLYKSDFCHTEKERTQEQPSVTGGSTVNVVFVDL